MLRSHNTATNDNEIHHVIAPPPPVCSLLLSGAGNLMSFRYRFLQHYIAREDDRKAEKKSQKDFYWGFKIFSLSPIWVCMPQNIWLRGGGSDINNQHVTAQKQRMGRFHCEGSSMRSAEGAEDNLGRSSRSGNWLSSGGVSLSKEKRLYHHIDQTGQSCGSSITIDKKGCLSWTEKGMYFPWE